MSRVLLSILLSVFVFFSIGYAQDYEVKVLKPGENPELFTRAQKFLIDQYIDRGTIKIENKEMIDKLMSLKGEDCYTVLVMKDGEIRGMLRGFAGEGPMPFEQRLRGRGLEKKYRSTKRMEAKNFAVAHGEPSWIVPVLENELLKAAPPDINAIFLETDGGRIKRGRIQPSALQRYYTNKGFIQLGEAFDDPDMPGKKVVVMMNTKRKLIKGIKKDFDRSCLNVLLSDLVHSADN